MDDTRTTIDYRGTTPPRFGAGCAACGVSGATTAVRFAGAKGKFSFVGFLAAYAALAGSTTFFLAASRTALAVFGGGCIVLVLMKEWLERRAASLQVPMCTRCASDVAAIRNADRTFLAVLVICATIALVSAAFFGSVPWVIAVFRGCVVAVVILVVHRAWRATKESDRVKVTSRIGCIRFQFADDEAARRFEAENPGEAMRVGAR